jgi:hypothetical protein
MYKVKSEPWPKIAEFYSELASEPKNVWLTPMVGFVEKIGAAEWAGNLHGSTSHMRLRISYLPEVDPDKELLNVDLDHENGQFKFEYQETSSPLYKRWTRTCGPEEAFAVLQRFLRRVNWFYPQKSLKS